MIKLFIYFLLFFNAFSLEAQENLVPNGSFEEYNTCPDINPPYYFVDRAKHWFMPTLGSSDYFNSCSNAFDSSQNTYRFSVPQNYIGYQNARTGEAYAGFVVVIPSLTTPANHNYEYLSAKLTSSLTENKIYQLTLYLSLADSVWQNGDPQQYVNQVGVAFTSDSLSIGSYDLLNFYPHINSDPNVYLNDSMGWQKVTFYYISNGTEEHMTIGIFSKINELKYNYVNANTAYGVDVYYYIDDIELIETNIELTNVFTPNNDGKNDVFEFPFENVSSYKIMNRWGSLVFDSETMNTKTWDGTTNGQKCTEGAYFYTINLEGSNINGFIELIR